MTMPEDKSNLAKLMKEHQKMKKRYTKKFILEALAYWKKQLRMMNESGTDGKIDILQLLADKAGVKIEQLIDAALDKVNDETDALADAGFDSAKYYPGIHKLYLNFEEAVEGHFEDYGIGEYEYWGSRGYDSDVGFEIESGGLDEDLMSDAGYAVSKALFGKDSEQYDSIRISDEIDPDRKVQHGNVSIDTSCSPEYIDEVFGEDGIDSVL